MSPRGLATIGLAAALTCTLVTGAEGGQTPSPAPQPASAAALDAARAVLKLKNGDVDLGVPESPALISLDLSPDTVIRPTTPREFATALLNGVDRSGHLHTGVAIDAVPYLVYAGSRISLKDYRASRRTQILARTQTSFATTKGATDDDPSVKLAMGIHSTLFDSEDPRLNNDALLQCFSNIPNFRASQLPVSANTRVREQQEAALALEKETFEDRVLRPAVEVCREQFQRKARWNGTSVIVAAATTWVSPTGLAGDLDAGSLALWTSFSYGFDDVPGLSDRAQVIVHLRHISNELVVDADLPAGQELRDSTFAGARLRAGTNNFGLSFEAAYVRTSAAGRASDTAARLAFEAERRLANNLWITVSFGGESGADPALSRGMSLLSAFKWAVTKDPTLSLDQLQAVGR